jgi:uncharacterized protein YgbK (DUF1537 family)
MVGLRIVIVADDLTGACDTGAAFAPATVVVRGETPDARVLVFSSESRNDPPDLAARKVRDLQQRLPATDIFYKKIDSMLRGNVASEFAALRVDRPVWVCPAFPAQGRIVRGGVAYPAGADLRPMFPGARILDASSGAELREIAAEFLCTAPLPVLVGSAGLARAVATMLQPPPARPVLEAGGLRPTLYVGSTNEATRAQVEYLRRHRSNFELVEIDMSRKPVALARPESGFFVCGGDTASLVFELMGVARVELEFELMPGIPFGRVLGKLPIVTKSGGFGKEDSLVCVVDALSGDNGRSGE